MRGQRQGKTQVLTQVDDGHGPLAFELHPHLLALALHPHQTPPSHCGLNLPRTRALHHLRPNPEKQGLSAQGPCTQVSTALAGTVPFRNACAFASGRGYG